MKRLGIISAAVISVVMLATSAFAQDFQKGLDAYELVIMLQPFKSGDLWLSKAMLKHKSILGLCTIRQGVPQDYAEAVKWYRLAAEQGDAVAQYNLGVMYDNGQGVPQDYAEAVKWYRLAAEQGYAHAQRNLGVMYDKAKAFYRIMF